VQTVHPRCTNGSVAGGSSGTEANTGSMTSSYQAAMRQQRLAARARLGNDGAGRTAADCRAELPRRPAAGTATDYECCRLTPRRRNLAQLARVLSGLEGAAPAGEG
jgi:hypothetical protein